MQKRNFLSFIRGLWKPISISSSVNFFWHTVHCCKEPVNVYGKGILLLGALLWFAFVRRRRASFSDCFGETTYFWNCAEMRQKDYKIGTLQRRVKSIRRILWRMVLEDNDVVVLLAHCHYERVKKDLRKLTLQKRALRAIYFNFNIFSTNKSWQLFCICQNELGSDFQAFVMEWSHCLTKLFLRRGNSNRWCGSSPFLSSQILWAGVHVQNVMSSHVRGALANTWWLYFNIWVFSWNDAYWPSATMSATLCWLYLFKPGFVVELHRLHERHHNIHVKAWRTEFKPTVLLLRAQ